MFDDLVGALATKGHMKRILVVVTLVLCAPALGAAQPSRTPASEKKEGIPLQQFLERRVVEELAAEGTMLARLGYSISIVVSGKGAEVSLLDTTSQRVVRATKIAALSSDREAAVATVTQVVANLVAQQSQVLAEPMAVPSESPPSTSRPPTARPNRDDAEARYAREAIGFGTWMSVNGQGEVVATSGGGRAWSAWQGELRTTLTPTQFYRLVGRPDLEKERQSRSSSGSLLIGVAVAGYITTIAAEAYLLSRVVGREEPPSVTEFIVLPAVVGIGGLSLSSVILFSGIYKKATQPINEAEAKRLAQKHNDNLRRKYGLPVAAIPRTLRPDFRLTGVAPYVAENQAGVAVQLSF